MSVTVKEFFASTKAHIDPEKFRHLPEGLYDVMRRCVPCWGTFWSLWDPSSDVLGRLPDEVRRLALNALDHLERGYCISVYRASDEEWPGRDFVYLVAAKKVGERYEHYLYEHVNGDPVPLVLVIKKLAEREQFWSWRSVWAKIWIGLAAAYVALGLVMALMLSDTLWVQLCIITVMSICGPMWMLMSPRRSYDRSVAQTKAMAAKLPTPVAY